MCVRLVGGRRPGERLTSVLCLYVCLSEQVLAKRRSDKAADVVLFSLRLQPQLKLDQSRPTHSGHLIYLRKLLFAQALHACLPALHQANWLRAQASHHRR